jgi:hypothetical protein
MIEGQSFFVGLQWLGTAIENLVNNPVLNETFRNKKLLTYRRNLGRNNDGWYGWYDKTIVFFPVGVVPDKAAPINVLASAEIEVFEKSEKLNWQERNEGDSMRALTSMVINTG